VVEGRLLVGVWRVIARSNEGCMQWCRSMNLPPALCGADGHTYVGSYVHRLLWITALMRCGQCLCDTSVLEGKSDGPCSARSASVL